MKQSLAALAAGLLFALGLGMGGMTDPANVQAFLDVTRSWDPSLAFVMGGALGTHALLRRFVLRRPAPVLAASFPTFAKSKLDCRLLLGSALFGIGWGLSGFCPGPALTSVASGGSTALTFAASMLGGMFLFHLWESNRNARAAATRNDEHFQEEVTSP